MIESIVRVKNYVKKISRKLRKLGYRKNLFRIWLYAKKKKKRIL